MTYALVSDIAVSWATYEDVAAPALDELPEGLIIHVAGPTDEGVRVIDIWKSESAYRTFLADRLHPLLGRSPGASATAMFRDLQVEHVAAAVDLFENQA